MKSFVDGNFNVFNVWCPASLWFHTSVVCIMNIESSINAFISKQCLFVFVGDRIYNVFSISFLAN